MPLRGVSKLLTPDLLHCLSSMGHGDEIVLSDAHFPGSSVAKSSQCGTLEIRCDPCSSLPDLLKAILKFFPLDEYVASPVFLMDLVDSDKQANFQVPVWKEFAQILEEAQGKPVKPTYVERFQFYEQAKKAYAIVITGDVSKYGNIILKKGCVLD